MAGLADGCLDILAGAREVEAGIAALKARAAVTYAESGHAVAGPGVPVQAEEIAVAAEVGCVLDWARGRRDRSWLPRMPWSRSCQGPWRLCGPDRCRGAMR